MKVYDKLPLMMEMSCFMHGCNPPFYHHRNCAYTHAQETHKLQNDIEMTEYLSCSGKILNES